MKRHCKTSSELADALGMTRQALYKGWMHKEGFPLKTAHGWDIEECAKWIKDQKAAQQQKKQTGQHADKKGAKLDREIEILDIKIATMRKELIPEEEVRRMLQEYAAAVNGAFDQWIAFVATLTRDAELVGKSE